MIVLLFASISTTCRKNLNQQLFTVIGRRLKPTRAADQLYPKALIINRQVSQLTETTLSVCVLNTTEINIHYDISLPIQWMVAVEQEISETFPYLQLNWIHRNAEESLHALQDKKAQFAILTRNTDSHLPTGLKRKNLGTINLSPFTGMGNPLARLEACSLTDLQQQRQYVCENHIKAGLNGIVLSSDARIISNLDVLVELISHQGWAFLPDNYAEPFVRRDTLKMIDTSECVKALSPASIKLDLCYSEMAMQDSISRHLLNKLSRMADKY